MAINNVFPGQVPLPVAGVGVPTSNPTPLSKVMTGARAIVSVDGNIVGLFEGCTYGANISTEQIHILGRYSTAEITPTSYEAITVSCQGFRVIGAGVHTLPKFPKLQDLINLGSVQISITDRQTGETIMQVDSCIPTSYNTGVNARGTSRISVNYIGLRVSDESDATAQQETNGATSLP